MSEHREDINRLAEEFEGCQKILLALGDENRQHLMLEMMRMEHCGGVRVGTITEKTHLSTVPIHPLTSAAQVAQGPMRSPGC